MKLNLNFLSHRKKSVSKKIQKTFIRVEKVVRYLMLIEWYWIDNNTINSRNIYWPIFKRKCTTQWIVMKKFTNFPISAPQQKTFTSETIAQSRTSFVICKKIATTKKKKKKDYFYLHHDKFDNVVEYDHSKCQISYCTAEMFSFLEHYVEKKNQFKKQK